MAAMVTRTGSPILTRWPVRWPATPPASLSNSHQSSTLERAKCSRSDLA